MLAPFVVYADFESILKHDDNVMDATQGVAADSGESSFRAFQEHVPCSFAYKIVSSSVSDFSKPLVSYRGEDAAEMFVRKLQEEAKQLFDEYIATPRPLLPLTVADMRSCHTAINCHICNQPLGNDKVRDHCHIVVLHIVGVI